MDPAVVAVLRDATSPSATICTGTMIDARLILTAKHCVQEEGASAPDPTSRFLAITLDRIGGATSSEDILEIDSIDVVPGTWRASDNSLQGMDVAVLTTRRAWSGTAYPLWRSDPSDAVGRTGRIVGYGQSDLSTNGVENATTATITDVESSVIVTEPRTCPGDSGAPLFSEEGYLLGVLSTAGGSSACGAGVQSRFEPVFAHLDMIDAVAARIGAVLPTGPGAGATDAGATARDAGTHPDGDGGAITRPPDARRDRGGCSATEGADEVTPAMLFLGGCLVIAFRRRGRGRIRSVGSGSRARSG